MTECREDRVAKALELHADCETDNCHECPYEEYLSKADGNCVCHLTMDARAVIQEKNAEVTALKEECEDLRKELIKRTRDNEPKHPSYNCQRGMLCPTCDKALWTRVEIQGILGTKKVTVKEQPNFCKFCGQPLLAAYTEH